MKTSLTSEIQNMLLNIGSKQILIWKMKEERRHGCGKVVES